jgi:chromosome partitioning protein
MFTGLQVYKFTQVYKSTQEGASMLTVTIASGKGGTCKTTLTAALAVIATKEAKRVAIADLNADQESLTNWWRRRGEPANPYLVELPKGANFQAELRALAATRFEFCLIDTPPDEMDVLRRAIRASSAVLIPVRASTLDIEGAKAIVGLCQDHRKSFAFLITAYDTRPNFKALNKDTLEDLEALGGPVFEPKFSYRPSYIAAMAEGKTGHEVDSSLEREVARIWSAVKQIKRDKNV